MQIIGYNAELSQGWFSGGGGGRKESEEVHEAPQLGVGAAAHGS